MSIEPKVSNFDPADPWPEIVPFTKPINLPAFPIEALPTALSNFVSEVAQSRQVPLDLPGMLAPTVVAAASARRVRIQIGETHSEPTNLFTATPLESGNRKSDVFRDMVAPLEQEEELLAEAARPRIAAAREQWEVEEARLKHLRALAAKENDPAERDQLIDEATQLAAARTAVPAEPKMIVGDITPEKLASRLAENGRIALMDAEAGSVFEMMAGRYSNGVPNLDVYLRGHAGDSLRVDRVGRPSASVAYPALTIALAPQPIVLENLGKQPQFRGRGLLARFLYSLPKSLAGTRAYRNRPISQVARREYEKAIRRVMDLLAAAGDSPFPWHVVKMSPEALEVWRVFHDKYESRLGDDGPLAGIRDWVSKLAGAVARTAGNFHLVDAPAPLEAPVSAETVTAAWVLGEYFVPHALAAFALMATDPHVVMAQKIRDWIARGGRDEFSLRDAHRAFPGVGRSVDLLPAIAILESRGYVAELPEPDRRGQPGRRPSPRFKVNPALKDLKETST